MVRQLQQEQEQFHCSRSSNLQMPQRVHPVEHVLQSFDRLPYSIALHPRRPSIHGHGVLQGSLRSAISTKLLVEVLAKQAHSSYLVITIKFKILFWLESMGIRMLGSWLNALCNIRQYLLHSKHSIGIQSRVAISSCDTRQQVLEWLQYKRDLNRLLEGNLVLLVVSCESTKDIW